MEDFGNLFSVCYSQKFCSVFNTSCSEIMGIIFSICESGGGIVFSNMKICCTKCRIVFDVLEYLHKKYKKGYMGLYYI